MNKNRLEAFSDGVLAIIITIMVLEFKMPHSAEWISLKALFPKFISYIISFMYVAIYWNNHHHLLHATKKISSGIMWANLNLLFWLSLVPFATSWMGENHFEKNPVILYTIILLACAITFSILQYIISSCHKTDIQIKQALQSTKIKGYISVVGYILAILLAFVNPYISCLIVFLVAVAWVVPSKDIEKALSEEN